jgi:chloramphenicol 3-O phosphotransferase
MPERIILLNGTSSAGTTTIARASSMRSSRDGLSLGFDEFVGMLTDSAPGPTDGPSDLELDRWLAEAWYRTVAGLVSAGYDSMTSSSKSYRLGAALRLLAPLDVTFVAVRCPLDVAVQRERDRGDRDIGLVVRQFEMVHADRIYDREIDTTTLAPQTCAAAIRGVVEDGGVRAFDEMSRTRGT